MHKRVCKKCDAKKALTAVKSTMRAFFKCPSLIWERYFVSICIKNANHFIFFFEVFNIVKPNKSTVSIIKTLRRLSV